LSIGEWVFKKKKILLFYFLFLKKKKKKIIEFFFFSIRKKETRKETKRGLLFIFFIFFPRFSFFFSITIYLFWVFRINPKERKTRGEKKKERKTIKNLFFFY
jgi:hypothetical protein